MDFGEISREQAINVLLHDLVSAGISDAVCEDPMVLLENAKPFASLKPTLTAPQVLPTVEPKPSLKEVIQKGGEALRSDEAKRTPKKVTPLRSYAQDTDQAHLPENINDRVWVSGNGDALTVITYGQTVGEQPFVGEVSKLFAKMMHAIGKQVSDITFIAMLETENRAEYGQYAGVLRDKLSETKANNVLVMGQLAANVILAEKGGFAECRGVINTLNHKNLIATYHPAMLMSQPVLKRLAWQDLLLLKQSGQN